MARGHTHERGIRTGSPHPIDAAKAAGVKHVVLVSSMGGVTPCGAAAHQLPGNKKSGWDLIFTAGPYLMAICFFGVVLKFPYKLKTCFLTTIGPNEQWRTNLHALHGFTPAHRHGACCL